MAISPYWLLPIGYCTVHRIGTETHDLEHQHAVTLLKQYIFAYQNREFRGKLDIILTFAKETWIRSKPYSCFFMIFTLNIFKKYLTH